MPGRELQIRLYRDALSTPWGFRLYGGKDLRTPLTVQKIAAGSPVFGELQRDDVILEIQNCDATQMTHKQAQDMIRNAGGSLLLRIRRSGGRPETAMPVAHDVAGPQRGFMLGRVKDTLTNVLDYSPTSGYGSNNNFYSPSSSYTSLDSTLPSTQPVKTWNLPKPAYKAHPSNSAGLMEPGWTPDCMKYPRRRPGPTQPILTPRPHHQQYPAPIHSPTPPHVNNEPPAWAGSLRPSIDARRSDERIGPRSASPEFARYATAASWAPEAPGNNVVVAPEGVTNLQYNTPVGLYSKANVQEALTGQVGGLSLNQSAGGQPRDSDVYRLVKDDDRHKAPHRSTTTGYSHLHAAAADDSSIRQSPSVRILEQRLAHPGATDGMSDF